MRELETHVYMAELQWPPTDNYAAMLRTHHGWVLTTVSAQPHGQYHLWLPSRTISTWRTEAGVQQAMCEYARSHRTLMCGPATPWSRAAPPTYAGDVAWARAAVYACEDAPQSSYSQRLLYTLTEVHQKALNRERPSYAELATHDHSYLWDHYPTVGDLLWYSLTYGWCPRLWRDEIALIQTVARVASLNLPNWNSTRTRRDKDKRYCLCAGQRPAKQHRILTRHPVRRVRPLQHGPWVYGGRCLPGRSRRRRRYAATRTLAGSRCHA